MKRISATTCAMAVVALATVVPSAAYADPPAGKLLLVLDSSGSMKQPAGDGHSKIDNAKRALNQLVDSLDTAAPVGMRVYGATVFDKSQPGACTDSQLAVPIGPAGDKSALKAAIARYKPYGETPIAYSLLQAGNDLGTSGQRSIVLVSDGEETCDADPCAVAKSLADKGIDLRIDVIGLGVSGKARNQLQCVASKGRGTYTDANNRDELQQKLVVAKDRALRPFEATGTPVTGGIDLAGAPQIGSGRWVTKLPDRAATSYYKLRRTAEGSTFWVGISSPISSRGEDYTGFDVELTTEAGIACGTVHLYNLGYTSAGLLTGSIVTRAALRDEECRSGDLIVAVNQREENAVDAAGLPVQLDVFEEPPLRSESGLPPRATDQPTWTPVEFGHSSTITGGTSFTNATRLEDNRTYAFDIAAGETQVFKVRASWGQLIQARAGIGTYQLTSDFSVPVVHLDVLVERLF